MRYCSQLRLWASATVLGRDRELLPWEDLATVERVRAQQLRHDLASVFAGCHFFRKLPERLPRENSDVLGRAGIDGGGSHSAVQRERQRDDDKRGGGQGREHGTAATSQAQARLRKGGCRLDGRGVVHDRCLSCCLSYLGCLRCLLREELLHPVLGR